MDNNFATIEPVLVVGSTGNLGKEICRQLIRLDLQVKGLVRPSSSPEKLQILHDFGVEMIDGDMKDRSSLLEAFKGVKTVISTATSTLSRAEGDTIESVDGRGQINVIEAAAMAGVQKFIFISFPHVPLDFPLQSAKRQAESKLKESGMEFTILQPGFFHEIWFAPMLGFDYYSGIINVYGEGDKKLSTVATSDVASFTVASLSNKSARNATIQISNGEALTPREMVNVFEREAGRSFQIKKTSLEILQSEFDNANDSLSKSFAALKLNYAMGSAIDMTTTLQHFDIKPTSMSEYAKKVLTEVHAVA
jgi:uncharacterized protein YbjT (DUF2867 family)